MGRKLTLGGGKYYGPSPNKKTGEPATLQPGDVHKNLVFQETIEATKSKYKGYNHRFLKDGEPVTFNGTQMLNSFMKQVKVGEVVNITFVKKEICPFGKHKGDKTFVYEVEILDADEAVGVPREANTDNVAEETADTDETEIDAF